MISRVDSRSERSPRCLIALALITPAQVAAQNAPPQAAAPPPMGGGQTFKQEELDAILAPIALYPDSLLSRC